MNRTRGIARPWIAALLLAVGLATVADPARAQFFDSRSMALGGTKQWHHRGTLVRVNPAYRAVPREMTDPRWRFALPLGLVQNLGDLSAFDPDGDDLDLTQVGRWMLNVPWALQLRWQNALSRDLTLTRESPSQLLLDLGQAREFLPHQNFDLGNLNEILDLGYELNLGQRYGLVHVGVQGFVHNEGRIVLDDELAAILEGSKPITAGQAHHMRGSGLLQGGLTLGAIYARSIPLGGRGAPHDGGGDGRPMDGTNHESNADWLNDFWNRENQRPRLWVGAGVRGYLGLAYAGLDADATLTGVDPSPTGSSAFAVDYDALYTTAHAKLLGDFGTAFGLELGSLFRWRGLELGAGVADLFTEMTWRNTRRHRVSVDPTDLSPTRVLVDEGVEASVKIPPSWLLDASYPWRDTLIVTDWGGGPGGQTFHLGAEHRLRTWLALRAGTELDNRGAWQLGSGFGLLGDRWGADLGLRTHSRNLNEERGVELGLSVVVAY